MLYERCVVLTCIYSENCRRSPVGPAHAIIWVFASSTIWEFARNDAFFSFDDCVRDRERYRKREKHTLKQEIWHLPFVYSI